MLIIFTLIMGGVIAQTSDLIYQMDVLFKRLNSESTVNLGDIIANNTILALESINSNYTQNVTKEIMNNLRDILATINSEDTKDLIHNLRTFTQNSKVYVDVNDNKMGGVIVLMEILLVLLIILSFFLLTMCIIKVFKSNRNINNLEELYIPFNNPLQQENRIEDNENNIFTS